MKEIYKEYFQKSKVFLYPLLEIKKGISNKDFATTLLSLNMEEIVKSKLVNINKEYVKAHVEVLKDIKPQVNND